MIKGIRSGYYHSSKVYMFDNKKDITGPRFVFYASFWRIGHWRINQGNDTRHGYHVINSNSHGYRFIAAAAQCATTLSDLLTSTWHNVFMV